ncbi:MAG TPA: hypothetical protein VLN72_04345, partial [Gillisia sp.]|nr:hypothetical protein [Gillisia sp.]
MKIYTYILFLFCTVGVLGQEQEIKNSYTFTLEEAIDFGIKNNYSSRIASKEIEKTLKQKWEIIAQG